MWRVLQAQGVVSADDLGRERGQVYWQKDTQLGEPKIPDQTQFLRGWVC